MTLYSIMPSNGSMWDKQLREARARELEKAAVMADKLAGTSTGCAANALRSFARELRKRAGRVRA